MYVAFRTGGPGLGVYIFEFRLYILRWEPREVLNSDHLTKNFECVASPPPASHEYFPPV